MNDLDWPAAGRAVRQARQRRGLTQDQLGVSKAQVDVVEHARREVSDATLAKIEGKLGWPAGTIRRIAEGGDIPRDEFIVGAGAAGSLAIAEIARFAEPKRTETSDERLADIEERLSELQDRFFVFTVSYDALLEAVIESDDVRDALRDEMLRLRNRLAHSAEPGTGEDEDHLREPRRGARAITGLRGLPPAGADRGPPSRA